MTTLYLKFALVMGLFVKIIIMTFTEFEKILSRLKTKGLNPDTEIKIGIYGGGSSEIEGLYLDDDKKLIIH